ncbi:MAG: VOC family protein [Chitinophagaceae bacterium]|nr:MAG: VOC family protein [Chitinophagaceae bacterium]
MTHALYLMFNGNCEEAMNFYKDALGATVTELQRYGETPVGSSESYKDKIMHGIMNIMGFTVMFSDADEKRNVQFGDNFSIALTFKSDGELNRAFDALATGGIVTMAVQDTFWGATFGMCTDKFGVNWMVNYDKPKS